MDLFAWTSKFEAQKVINLEFYCVMFMRLIIMLLGNTVLSFLLVKLHVSFKIENIV